MFSLNKTSHEMQTETDELIAKWATTQTDVDVLHKDASNVDDLNSTRNLNLKDFNEINWE